MPVDTKAIGKEWGPTEYTVGLEKIREYANAVGEKSPVHQETSAATEAGFRDVVAPPMFCVVYSSPAVAPVLFDPEVGINFATMLHGGQEFVWGEPVCAGDVISTKVICKEIFQKDDKGFYVFVSISTNQDGQEVCRGTWTNIVRGVE